MEPGDSTPPLKVSLPLCAEFVGRRASGPAVVAETVSEQTRNSVGAYLPRCFGERQPRSYSIGVLRAAHRAQQYRQTFVVRSVEPDF